MRSMQAETVWAVGRFGHSNRFANEVGGSSAISVSSPEPAGDDYRVANPKTELDLLAVILDGPDREWSLVEDGPKLGRARAACNVLTGGRRASLS